MLKRWWQTAVALIALCFLTSCSKKTAVDQSLQSGDYAFTQCNGSIGSFDVYVIPTQTSGVYTLEIVPVSISQDVAVGKVDLASSSGGYQEIAHEVGFVPNQPFLAGVITDNELANREILAITPFDSSGDPFLQQDNTVDALCTLPYLGDGSGPNGN